MNMIRLMNLKCTFPKYFRNISSFKNDFLSSRLEISEEVKIAFDSNLPIVALESTIITHGMPFPKNLKTAIEVEEIIRSEKCVPATIGILNGKIKVGMKKEELKILADSANANEVIKTSRRDLCYVLSKNLNGGTTVAGTMIIANLVGIKIFCTGGIGGVHRLGHTTMDISADLVELGRTPVAVISSGVKSILDIPRTLEYLETQGVFVGTYKSQNNDFPAFYSRISGSKTQYNFESTMEIAETIKASIDLKLESGILIAVPIPQEYALEHSLIDTAISNALKSADLNNIKGKEITPYLLSAISNITEGKSLISNTALIKNNAKIAAKIAYDMNKLEKNKIYLDSIVNSSSPIIIGGSILDTCITVLDDNLKYSMFYNLEEHEIFEIGI